MLTGVNLVITIFDKEDGKIIQYLSDSMDKFNAINILAGNIEVRKRYLKGDQTFKREELESLQDEGGAKYVSQPIITEIYTNDHVSEYQSLFSFYFSRF